MKKTVIIMNKQSRFQQRLQEAMNASEQRREADKLRDNSSPWPLSNYFLHMEKNRTPTKNKTYIELMEDGLIYVIDGMPEEPKIRETNQFMYPDEKKRVNAENYAYEKALASATRILCADQQQAEERIRQELGVRYSDMKPKPGIYSLPDVEWMKLDVKVARVFASGDKHKSMPLTGEVAILKE